MRALIAEDDPVQCRLIEGLLSRWGYDVVSAGDGASALRLLEHGPPVPLVIADWMMPGCDGLTLCREIRRRFAEPYVYVILLTARDQHDDIVRGFEAGADDYLVKPVRYGELHARVRAAQRILDLQEKLLAAQERLRIQATHDALTEIWNRRAIFEGLAKELERAQRQQAALAVVMIDLDHFKQINDEHGHLVGDEVLRVAAQRIRAAIRSYDSVGRYGGEEFLVLAPGDDDRGAMELAERVRRAFEDEPIATAGMALRVTVSAGVVALARGQSAQGERLLAAADEALYQAKAQGRNVTVLGAI